MGRDRRPRLLGRLRVSRRGSAEDGPPSRRRPTRYHAWSLDEAASALAEACAQWAAAEERPVVVVGSDDQHRGAVVRHLTEATVDVEVVDLDRDGAAGHVAAAVHGVGAACIGLTATDVRTQHRLARALLDRPETRDVPLEVVATPRLENAPVARWDPYTNADFVSPALLRHGSRWFEVYEESLSRFELKTDVRDFLDVAQLLESVVERKVPGHVAEFGSYRGHSGYLMSRVLEELGERRQVHLFDTFDTFPDEDAGVDGFWSGTHQVDFDEVRRRFVDRPDVTLVRGEFTSTVPDADLGAVALAHVDCDSYRATRWLLRRLWDHHLVVGGVIAVEDYGHAALIGSRLAVHEFFDGRTDAFAFFSQFSGVYCVVRLPGDGGAG